MIGKKQAQSKFVGGEKIKKGQMCVQVYVGEERMKWGERKKEKEKKKNLH